MVPEVQEQEASLSILCERLNKSLRESLGFAEALFFARLSESYVDFTTLLAQHPSANRFRHETSAWVRMADCQPSPPQPGRSRFPSGLDEDHGLLCCAASW